MAGLSLEQFEGVGDVRVPAPIAPTATARPAGLLPGGAPLVMGTPPAQNPQAAVAEAVAQATGAPAAPAAPTFARVPTGGSTQQRVKGADYIGAEKGLAAAQGAVQEAIAAAGVGDVAAGEASQALATEKLVEEQRLAKERDLQRAEKQKIADGTTKYLGEQEKKRSGWKMEDYFSGEGGTGRRILAAISMGLGAFASAKTGGPNYAMEIINKSIEQDFRKQMSARDNLDALVEQARAGDERAQLAIRAVGLEYNQKRGEVMNIIATRAEQLAAKAGTETARTNALKMAAMAREQYGKDKIEREKEFNSLVQKSWELQQTGGPGAPGATGQGGVRGPGGNLLFSTGDPKKDTELSEGIGAYRELKRLIAEQRASFKEYGAERGGDEAAKREARVGRAALLIKNMEQGGALDKGMVEIVEKMFPSNTGRVFGRGEGVAKLQAFEESIDNQLRSKIDAAGGPGNAVVGAIAQTGAARPMSAQETATLNDVIRRSPGSEEAKRARAALGATGG